MRVLLILVWIYHHTECQFAQIMRQAIIRALAYWRKLNTCVEWKQKYNYPEENQQIYPYVTFAKATGINSYVRKNYGPGPTHHIILISDYHFSATIKLSDDETTSLILHMMLHYLNIPDEHQRPDRDCYVFVDKWYAENDPSFRTPTPYKPKLDFLREWKFDSLNGFLKRNSAFMFSQFPYDHHSVMQYPPIGRGYNGLWIKNPSSVTWENAVIRLHERFHGTPIHSLGRVNGTLSMYDIWKVNWLWCGELSYCERRRDKTCTDVDEPFREEKFTRECNRTGWPYIATTTPRPRTTIWRGRYGPITEPDR
uniref:Peptidase M12A domain-containing protein n=1 Tax=Homalodisca liturata TaxID=320908 RepID=A0A1B6I1Q7_9HEMI